MEERELLFAGIVRQAELVRSRDVSSKELVEACLGQIDRLDGHLNAFRSVFRDSALQAAKAADRKRKASADEPLRGVPVAIKDEFDIEGEVTAAGTSAFSDPAPADSQVVARLREAGAIILGKTNMPELGQWPFTISSTFGVTRNPWDPERVPGGSSGGSAAAVASGMVGAALGGDGGGSIRIPAAACGLFGLKCQRGRVPLLPKAEHWGGLTVAGPLTRTVADSAAFYDIVRARPGEPDTPPDPDTTFTEAAAAEPGRLRIAVSYKTPALGVKLDPEIRSAVEALAGRLEGLGHEVSHQDPDYGEQMAYFLPRWMRGIANDVAATPRPDLLERRTRGMARLGRMFAPAFVEKVSASGRHGDYFDRLQRVFVDHDVVLTPTLATPAPPIVDFEGIGPVRTMLKCSAFTPYTPFWNVTGQPAASVPVGFTSSGMPIGAQLVGRPNAETTLLSLSAQLEGELHWAEHVPPVAA